MDSLRKQHSSPQPSPQPVPSLHPQSQTKDMSTARPAHHHKSKKSPREQFHKMVMIVIGIFITSIIIFVGFFLYRIVAVTQHVTMPAQQQAQEENPQEPQKAPTFISTLTDLARKSDETILKGYHDGRINILLLGIAGTQKPGALLTDTIILVSINVSDHTVAFISLPRDLIVPFDKSFVKINSLYARGKKNHKDIAYIIDTVKDITAQDIHYYIIMDFEGFTQLIDALGGINVDVPFDLHDTRYPGPNYSYETFDITAGLQHLDGATALKYARSRHSDPTSDFGRAARQQQVLRAIRNKAFTRGTITNPRKINAILDAIGEHISMNIAPKEIPAFVALVNNLDTQNITTIVVDAWKPRSLLRSARRGNLPGLVPRSGDWSEIRELATTIFSRDKKQQRRARLIAEDASVRIINMSGNAHVTQHLLTLLKERGLENITTQQKPATVPTQQKTIIYDRTNGRAIYSLDELILRTQGETTTTAPKILSKIQKKNATFSEDIIVLVGKDLIAKFGDADISKEEVEKSNKN